MSRGKSCASCRIVPVGGIGRALVVGGTGMSGAIKQYRVGFVVGLSSRFGSVRDAAPWSTVTF